MRAVVQRVRSASITVEAEVVGTIETGLLVYVGVAEDDEDAAVDYLARKIAGLRIFEDEAGRFSRSVIDAGGAVLLVSQFTLYGDCRRGRRPSFDHAASPAYAKATYERLGSALVALGVPVSWGRFQAHMAVESVNDGPVTILLDSGKAF